MNTVDILSHIHVHDASKFIPTCSPTLCKVLYLGFYSRRNKPPVVVEKVCMKNCKFVNEWIVAKKSKYSKSTLSNIVYNLHNKKQSNFYCQ